MAIQSIQIEQFLALAKQHPVFDVRSPGEYNEAHIPGAYSLPIFTNEERKVIGTAYKQESRQQAIKIGLDYFGAKMRGIVEEAEQVIGSTTNKLNNDQPLNASKNVLVHCWRGGMRSGAVAWLLNLYGYNVYTLSGGYKGFRNWVLKQFDKPYNFEILGGYTGSGKTILLQELERLDYPVINLEELANHKGSAFGAIGEQPQPRQEMFENMLAMKLMEKDSFNKEGQADIWLEDESQRIGALIIPKNIWELMRSSPLYFIDIDFEKRVKYLVNTYGQYEKEKLINAITRIKKRLGGLETKKAVNYLLENNITEGFSVLLQYYDKWYTKGLYNRENLESLLHKISCTDIDTGNVSKLIMLQNKPL